MKKMLIHLPTKLKEVLMSALEKAGVEVGDGSRVQVTPAADLRYGDYQSNIAMMMAKVAKKNPRALAEEIVSEMEGCEWAECSIAGPGFINFTVKNEVWSEVGRGQWEAENLGVLPATESKTVVIDFSAPNVAKPMHVGHIRSTIIGECLGRIASRLGHEVIKDNHLGDWGTQFGMVTWAWKKGVDEASLEKEPLQELLRLYREASDASKADEGIKEECRQELVKLQSGDEENLAIWNRCVALSKKGLDEIYDRLEVSFDHWMGESAYNDALAPLVVALEEKGLARESDGALCVFSEGVSEKKRDPFLINRDGEWMNQPMIVRKKDGGYNYATTDIATICYRVEEWKADEIWYVVDFRQGMHFEQLFEVARRLGYGAVDLNHVSFGTILGRDGKPLKTRAGDLPQLADVLDDAVKAARVVVEERSRLEAEEEKDALAELIGVNSVKFTELSHHRMSDYVFDLDKMVALEGDTAPYLFYSYVRARSIFRKLENGEAGELRGEDLKIREDAEVSLMRLLSRYGDNVAVVLDDFRPNLLATYLLDLARAFHSFFEACPVLKADGETKKSRLVLCDLTSKVLRDGLSLLGLKAPEKM